MQKQNDINCNHSDQDSDEDTHQRISETTDKLSLSSRHESMMRSTDGDTLSHASLTVITEVS